jgi:acyl-CoA thioester hydrolase
MGQAAVMMPETHDGAMVNETRLRVRYAETDQMQVVYHSNYVIWFEVGRVELLRQIGFTYRDMEEQDGYHLPVAEVRCRFKQPAKYDDVIFVRTRMSNLRSMLIQFHYEIYREQDMLLLAEGETTHFVVDKAMQKASLPEKYMGPFRKAFGK